MLAVRYYYVYYYYVRSPAVTLLPLPPPGQADVPCDARAKILRNQELSSYT